MKLEPSIRNALQARIGRLHLRQRLGIESTPQHVLGGGLNVLHLENWQRTEQLLRFALRVAGLYRRGQNNALRVELRTNRIVIPSLPRPFHGFKILQFSDLHLDMNLDLLKVLPDLVQNINYDLCVFTGDYRGLTDGPISQCMQAMRELRSLLPGPALAVLGNHDSIMMTPHLESIGIQVLLNESISLLRDDCALHLAGVDDAHYYRLDNIDKAAASFPEHETSILLSHTPEIYRQAAHAGFDLMLCGHTHGGQICLPGGIPLILESKCPRRMARGSWQYAELIGYTSAGTGTSILPVRFNCPPEITLHQLECSCGPGYGQNT